MLGRLREIGHQHRRIELGRARGILQVGVVRALVGVGHVRGILDDHVVEAGALHARAPGRRTGRASSSARCRCPASRRASSWGRSPATGTRRGGTASSFRTCRRELGLGQPGDLGDQLLGQRPAERFVAFGDDGEGPEAADDVVLEVFLQAARRIGVLGAERFGKRRQDDQGVDGDALGQRLVAGIGDRPAGIVVAVARDVDDAPLRLEGRSARAGSRRSRWRG